MNEVTYTKRQLMAMRVASVVALFLGWEWVVHMGWVDASFFGRPSAIFKSLVVGFTGDARIPRELGWTLWTALISFLIGAGAAILLGLLFVLFPVLEKVLDPIFSALNSMPRTALAPLLIVWFGLGMWSKVAIGASLCFFIVLQNTVAGIRGVNADHVILSRTLGLGPGEMFWKVTMPNAVPVMFAGLRLGVVVALLGVVAGEIIASERGVGQRIAYLAAAFDMNGVWALLIVLALSGMLVTWTLDGVERRLHQWQ
jgi:NitT/TauT family transport system permease protein